MNAESDSSSLNVACATAGIKDDGAAPPTPVNHFPSDPLSQIDDTFEVDTGSVDSIGLDTGSLFKTGVRTLINGINGIVPLSERIVLLNGRLDGSIGKGRVTYLAGHDLKYVTPLPGGTYSYSVTGTLPPGLTFFQGTGLLFGYPTAPGTSNFSITATNANGCTGTKPYAVSIAP